MVQATKDHPCTRPDCPACAQRMTGREFERWERTKADAMALAPARLDLEVCVPAVILSPDAERFVEGLARRAEGIFPRAGIVIYTTVLGRLHRVIVEDMEPELREPVEIAGLGNLSIPLTAEPLTPQAPPPVCSTCNDTHVMTRTNGSGDVSEVMCTRCPTPCEACRSRGPGRAGGPFCATTPCACDCHRPSDAVTRAATALRNFDKLGPDYRPRKR